MTESISTENLSNDGYLEPSDHFEIRALLLSAGPDLPNNPVLPVLVYRRAVRAQGQQDCATLFEAAFQAQGWQGCWRDGIYDYHHYHPSAHEVLGIAQGYVTVQLGGEIGRILRLEEGDMVVLPAGTGHINLGDSGDLLVVGAYPPGQEPVICRDYKDCRDASVLIAAVPVPDTDPLAGGDGPLVHYWRANDEGAARA